MKLNCTIDSQKATDGVNISLTIQLVGEEKKGISTKKKTKRKINSIAFIAAMHFH